MAADQGVAAELILAAADAAGILPAFLLLHELAEFTNGQAFVCAEVVADAQRPEHARLRRAIDAACESFAPRNLGKVLAKWEGHRLGSLRVDAVGTDPRGIAWIVSRG